MMIPPWLILASTRISTGGSDNTAEVAISEESKNIQLSSVLDTVYFWAGVVAIIVIVIAGFFYTLSQDNQQQVTRAKNALMSAVIGLAVIFFAYSMTHIVLEAMK